jgi:hypothetical protein
MRGNWDKLQPILDSTDSIQIVNPKDHELLGFIGVSVYWRDLLANILPPGDNGVVVVFENECNPTFTFDVHGPIVTYLGQGDLHDSSFDYLETAVSFTMCLFLAIFCCDFFLQNSFILPFVSE